VVPFGRVLPWQGRQTVPFRGGTKLAVGAGQRQAPPCGELRRVIRGEGFGPRKQRNRPAPEWALAIGIDPDRQEIQHVEPFLGPAGTQSAAPLGLDQHVGNFQVPRRPDQRAIRLHTIQPRVAGGGGLVGEAPADGDRAPSASPSHIQI